MKNRKKERNKMQEKQVIHNAVAHNQPIREQQSMAPAQHPPVYALGMTFYYMEYPVGQFGSVLRARLPPASCAPPQWQSMRH